MNNKKRFFWGVVAFSLVFLLAGVLSALAAVTAVTDVGPETLDEATKIIQTVVNWFQGIVLILGVMMIVWAGLTWMTAGGVDTKLTEARQRLIWGLVGIGVALFAGVAEKLVTDIIK